MHCRHTGQWRKRGLRSQRRAGLGRVRKQYTRLPLSVLSEDALGKDNCPADLSRVMFTLLLASGFTRYSAMETDTSGLFMIPESRSATSVSNFSAVRPEA